MNAIQIGRPAMTEQGHVNRAHALLAPSASHRWMECPASVARSYGEPNQSSPYAKQGTAAHELCEHIMRSGDDPIKYLGGITWLTANHEQVRVKSTENPEPDDDDIWEIDAEMVDGAQLYREVLLDIIKPGCVVDYECRVFAHHVHTDIFGSVDGLIFDPSSKRLTVVDFKYGQGIPVEATWNPQLLIYALGAAHRYNYAISSVEVVIVQPRAPHPKGPVRRFEIDTLDLIEWEAELHELAKRCDDPNAPAEVGDHCRFCPALYRCQDAREHILTAIGANWRALEGELKMKHLPDAKKLSPDDVARLLREIAVIKAYVKRVEEHAHYRAMMGETPTGLKLVEGKSNRVWKDQETAKNELIKFGFDVDDLYGTPKFLSPAAAETLLGKKNADKIKELWVKPKGKLVLAPVEDPRPAASPAGAADAFGAVEDEV